jgi:hypothetical protein
MSNLHPSYKLLSKREKLLFDEALKLKFVTKKQINDYILSKIKDNVFNVEKKYHKIHNKLYSKDCPYNFKELLHDKKKEKQHDNCVNKKKKEYNFDIIYKKYISLDTKYLNKFNKLLSKYFKYKQQKYIQESSAKTKKAKKSKKSKKSIKKNKKKTKN